MYIFPKPLFYLIRLSGMTPVKISARGTCVYSKILLLYSVLLLTLTLLYFYEHLKYLFSKILHTKFKVTGTAPFQTASIVLITTVTVSNILYISSGIFRLNKKIEILKNIDKIGKCLSWDLDTCTNKLISYSFLGFGFTSELIFIYIFYGTYPSNILYYYHYQNFVKECVVVEFYEIVKSIKVRFEKLNKLMPKVFLEASSNQWIFSFTPGKSSVSGNNDLSI